MVRGTSRNIGRPRVCVPRDGDGGAVSWNFHKRRGKIKEKLLKYGYTPLFIQKKKEGLKADSLPL